jgi:type IV pilus assembly protein PilA
MNRLRLKAEGGFTLIELLVVIAIIGILAAIAIPQFAAYRRRAFAAQVVSDMRNIAVAEEATFAANQVYLGTVCASPAVCAPAITGFLVSSTGVTATVVTPSVVGGPGTFSIAGLHAQCGADAWTYESSTGQIATVPLAAGICIP